MGSDYIGFVPVTGIEPVRVLRRGILSFLFSADFSGR
jgi:hypothetical protein